MKRHPTLRLCLEPPLLKSAEAGEHNFINLIVDVAENARFRVEYCPSTELELFKSVGDDVFTLSHMKHPPSGRGLVFRRVYHYPFWQIDQTAKRWDWDIARAAYDPSDVPGQEAARFAGYWKKRLFKGACDQVEQTGYIYVPLQGRIRDHRSFQSCSPLDMLRATLKHADGKPVVATLHPKEDYGAADLAALEALGEAHPHLDISMGDMAQHLQRCDFVVTQNSGVAFDGYFFGKAALLFGKIDFHHIAVRAEMDHLAASFKAVPQHRPDFDAYLWWFWQHQSINAGRDDAKDKIAARFRRFGWPI